MRWPLLTALVVVILVGSCQRTQPQERSLAGATVLPRIEELRGEDIALALTNYPKHERFSETLQIELRRDNSVRIAHVRDTFLPGYQDPREDVLTVVERRLPAALGDQARKRIMLLRPEGSDAIPNGCRWIADGTIDLQVAFLRQDTSVGFFNLQSGCDSPDRPKIRMVVRETLKALQVSPQSYGFIV